MNKLIKFLKGETYPYNGVVRNLNKTAAILQNNLEINKDLPKIDIILLTLNRKADTLRTIDSLYKTTTVDFNLIIIDQKSTDGTQNALRKLSSKYANIKLSLLEENIGVSGGRQMGIDMCGEKYVAYIDNDMVFCKGYFEYLLFELETNKKAAGALGQIVLPNYKIQLSKPTITQNSDWIIFTDSLSDTYLDTENVATSEADWLPGVAIWRLEVLSSVSFDTNILGAYEDNDFALKIKKSGYIFLSVPQSIVLHIKAEFTKSLNDSTYTKGRFEINKLRNAAKSFYQNHGKFIATGTIEGTVAYLGFESESEYTKFVRG